MTIDVIADFTALEHHKLTVAMSGQRRVAYGGPNATAYATGVGYRAEIEAGHLMGIVVDFLRSPAADPNTVLLAPTMVLRLSMQVSPEELLPRPSNEGWIANRAPLPLAIHRRDPALITRLGPTGKLRHPHSMRGPGSVYADLLPSSSCGK